MNPFAASRRFLQQIGSMTWMLWDTFQETAEYSLRGRSPLRRKTFFQQCDRVGAGSVPLVALVAFFIGLTMALLTGYQLRNFGQEKLVPALVAISFTRELGPLMTGIVLAARIGAAYTAELGTMTVAEEVEAIESMGIGAMRFLISPRIIATTFLMPCLVVVCNLMALLGAALISRWAFAINFEYFGRSALDSLELKDIVAGTIKSGLFGLIIGMVACYRGLSVKGGAAGVGSSTTSSVVTAITTVIVVDTIFNIVLVTVTPK